MNIRAIIAMGILPWVWVQGNSQHATAQPVVPDNLKPPGPASLVLKSPAKGIQIYRCLESSTNSNGDSTGFAWTLRTPQADLFDDKGKHIGLHFTGPTWKANDDSTVVGQVQAKTDAPNATAIPWLLLSAKTHAGIGIFSKVTSIQRLETVGGKAPSTGCDASKVNTEIQVPYRATYYFYGEGNQP
ncbi:MAG TPA: DUF3455 domain-containing protein [Stenomitos sp.]